MMETTYGFEQPNEIVLTYRQAEAAEPIIFRYERELPERMREMEKAAASRYGLDAPAPSGSGAAVFEGEKRPNWGVRVFVTLSVLVILVCIGVGVWLILRDDGPDFTMLPDIPSDEMLPGSEPYYWTEEDAAPAETTIRRYPSGGSVRLELNLGRGVLAELTPQEIYEKVNPAVVTVLSYQPDGVGVGTGIIFSSDGYIITNFHVIEGGSQCSIWIDNDANEYDAALVGYDEGNDLAVLKVDLTGLPTAEFGISDDLTVGDPVYAIGNPLGTELRNTFTNGIVSAVDREITLDGGLTMTLIQTNAALNSGNSGGPLINQYGQVVGVNTIKMMSAYDTIEGLGFAIPTSLAQRWVDELVEYGELLPQPVLGLSISRIPTVLPDGAVGLRVEEVTPGLSGEKAGVLVGDYVVAFAGQEVFSTEDILAIRRKLYVGDQVTIRVWRGDGYLELAMEMMAAAE